jgi:hypothetical protein
MMATRKPLRFPAQRQLMQTCAGTRQFSMWKRIVHAIVTMDGRKCVGEDEAGNKFWIIPAPGQQPNPRREIEYNASEMVQKKEIPISAMDPSAWFFILFWVYVSDTAPGRSFFMQQAYLR